MNDETLDSSYNLGWAPQFQDFRYCCGTTEIGQFRLEEVNATDPLLTIEDYRQRLMSVMKQSSVGSIVATTVDDSSVYNKMKNRKLALMGFEELTKYKNPNSGNYVIIWHISRDKL